VRDRIEAADALPDVAQLAADALVHPAYLARTFRRCYGVSIGQYARSVRLEWVARQLIETSAPLSAIAFRAGFADARAVSIGGFVPHPAPGRPIVTECERSEALHHRAHSPIPAEQRNSPLVQSINAACTEHPTMNEVRLSEFRVFACLSGLVRVSSAA
jgi:hypothetical protein